MQLCYIDESGTSQIPGNTSHFVLAGLAIPIWQWNNCDRNIFAIKKRYKIQSAELHTAWILRPYPEQRAVPDFDTLDHDKRAYEVTALRNAELLRLQRTSVKQYYQTRKNYLKTKDYIHLNFTERKALIKEVAQCVAGWGFARLFAEVVDKIHFDPIRASSPLDEQAFEQVVSRFETYLRQIAVVGMPSIHGLLIHDNNETVAKKHTDLMRRFHWRGTLWTDVRRIIETPLFVDSKLTSMVQIADLCGYALRRYVEKGEEELFDLVFQRADRRGGTVVGVRHFTKMTCTCKICSTHRLNPLPILGAPALPSL